MVSSRPFVFFMRYHAHFIGILGLIIQKYFRRSISGCVVIDEDLELEIRTLHQEAVHGTAYVINLVICYA